MCPRPVVVVDVLQQDLSKMPFADHDDVVQAFTSNRADHPLGIRVMPRRAERNDDLLDVQHPGLMRKSFSIDLVSVSNQIPGPLLQRARLEQLARRPFGSRMLRDIKMHQPTRTPQRIRAAHLPYQIPEVPPNRGPTPSASTLPCPVEPEAPAVPPHHGLRPHHPQRTPPTLPEPGQQDPEEPVPLVAA